MKSTKLALVVAVLCGSLSACREEPPAPEAETPPPVATEPVPAAPDPVLTDPAVPVPTEDVEEDDTPHTGGDRVGTGSGGGTGTANEEVPPEG